jgi:hypothetical protein
MHKTAATWLCEGNDTASMLYKLAQLSDEQVDELHKLATGASVLTMAGKMAKGLTFKKPSVGQKLLNFGQKAAPHMTVGGLGGAAVGAVTDKDDPMGGALKGGLLGAGAGAGVKYLGMRSAAKAAKAAT